MTDIKNDDKFLNTTDHVEDGKTIYLVNNSRSNKKFRFDGNIITLTAPGTPGSIQAADSSVLRNSALVTMWAAGDIKVTEDPEFSRKAISNLAIRNAEEAMAHEEAKKAVVEDIDGGGNENEEDVSYKAKRLTQPASPLTTMTTNKVED